MGAEVKLELQGRKGEVTMDLEQTAIARIREAARMSEKLYHLPLVVTDSGGKDSSVLRGACGAVRSRF